MIDRDYAQLMIIFDHLLQTILKFNIIISLCFLLKKAFQAKLQSYLTLISLC